MIQYSYNDSESGPTRVVQPQSIIYYGDYLLTLGLTGTNYVQLHKSHSSYKRKVFFIFDRGDFESYRQQLSLVDWDSLLVSDYIDISTSNITRALIDAANTNIPNRGGIVRLHSLFPVKLLTKVHQFFLMPAFSNLIFSETLE
jgi:hypothetical protein